MKNISGRVSDSGEGRWTILAGIESGAPSPVLTDALYERFTSRGESDFASKILSRDALPVRRAPRKEKLKLAHFA